MMMVDELSLVYSLVVGGTYIHRGVCSALSNKMAKDVFVYHFKNFPVPLLVYVRAFSCVPMCVFAFSFVCVFLRFVNE